jgi:hypothetical protein
LSVGELVKVILRQNFAHSAWLAGVLMLSAAPAHAESKARAQCAAKQKQLQALEQSGHLREARDAALECSPAVCGELVSQQCRTRHQILEEEIPSVVATAVDERGAPLVEVEVRVDGALLTTRIDGQGFVLDPGLHEFSFSAKDRSPYVQKILIVQGERNRRVSAVLQPVPSVPSAGATEAAAAVAATPPANAAPAAAAPVAASAAVVTEPSRHVSGWTYVVGGVGVAALGTSIALATWGHTDNQLLDQCAPNCSQESVDHVRHLYIAADISLGVGVVALGVATWMYFSTPRSAEPRADQAGNQFDVRIAPQGAFATWEHAF